MFDLKLITTKTQRVGVTGGRGRGGVGWEREEKRDQQRSGISVAATVGDCLSVRHTHTKWPIYEKGE